MPARLALHHMKMRNIMGPVPPDGAVIDESLEDEVDRAGVHKTGGVGGSGGSIGLVKRGSGRRSGVGTVGRGGEVLKFFGADGVGLALFIGFARGWSWDVERREGSSDGPGR